MKQLHSNKDLAIHGAEPAFETALHVGGPNVGNRDLFKQYVDEIFDTRWLANNGRFVHDFERAVAERHGVRHCVAMCNGTIALEIAIRATGLSGEVIVPSYTFIATAHALHWQALSPVFADIDPETHNLDPAAVERMVTSRTSGIVGVHLWGCPSALEALTVLARDAGLRLLFDAAHAFGCSYRGTSIGNFGDCEILSFHATKFFNTFEGGAVLTNDDDIAETMRLMRNFGFKGRDNVIHPGTNGKMSEISAAMGLVNLESLDDFIAINKRNYAAYAQSLADIEGVSLRPLDSNGSVDSNFQYIVIELDDAISHRRDHLVDVLHAENVIARRYFWPGCHRMEPYRDLNPHAGLLLPETERVAERVVVLPTGTSVEEADIVTIAEIIRIVLAERCH